MKLTIISLRGILYTAKQHKQLQGDNGTTWNPETPLTGWKSKH
jgi:hypothetical protein